MNPTTMILVAFYFALPAYLANMAPVIFGKLGMLKSLSRPIDGGRKLGKQFIFGSGKTWRGIISAVIFGVLVAWLQAWLFNFEFFNSISIIDYSNFILFGTLAGLGAILGDLIKSFFKRRLGVASGGVLPVFDQLDFIAGFFVFTFWMTYPPFEVIVTVFVITLILHPLTNIISYLLGIKKVWW